MSFSKQAEKVVFDGTAPPQNLIKYKRNGHTQQTAVLHEDSLDQGRVWIKFLQGLSLSCI